MENSSLIIVLALLSVFSQAYSLQCYICENCETVSEDQLKTCGAIEPPTTVTTDPSSNTTVTLAPPTTSTEAPASPNTSTEAPASPTTSTEAPASPTTSTEAPASPTTSTEAPAPAPNSIKVLASNSSEANKLAQPSAYRVKRYASETFAKLDLRATESYSCYKVKAKVNGTDQTFRGCTPNINTNKTACEELNAVINTTYCSTCVADKCNGATLLQFSLIPLLLALCLSLV